VNRFDASSSESSLPSGQMSLSQTLDRVWTILRGNLRLFLKMGTIPAGAVLATYALVFGGLYAFGVLPPRPGVPPDPQRMAAMIFPVLLVACIPILLAYALFEAAASRAALDANRGRASSLVEAYGAAWERRWRIVWLMILRWLLAMLPVMVVFGMIAAGVALHALPDGPNPNPAVLFVVTPFLVLAYLGSIVYLVWVTLRLGLAVPACMAEERTAVEAMRRSAQLTRGAMGRIFLVMLVVYAIGAAAIMVLEMVGFAVIAVVGLIASAIHVHLSQGVAIAGFAILVIAVFALFLLFMTISWASYSVAFAVLYDDQRNRLDRAGWPAMSAGPA
jgi:hypothetical protein